MNIQPIETSYKGYKFRSRLEARWAVCFDALGLQWEYEKEGFVLDGTPYLPDFWIESWKLWVEIKPKVFAEQSKGHDRCISLSKLNSCRCLLVSGNPWREEHDVIVCEDGYTIFLGEFGEINPRQADFVGFAVLNNLEGNWYPLDSFDQPLLDEAFSVARSARFEHGEKPR